MPKSDPYCICCCRRLSEHTDKRQCPVDTYFIGRADEPTQQPTERLVEALEEAIPKLRGSTWVWAKTIGDKLSDALEHMGKL